jgi:hypothetical protein
VTTAGLLPRRFHVVRGYDFVAEGVRWSSGRFTLHRPGHPTDRATYCGNSLTEALTQIGDGDLQIEWIDNDLHFQS